MFISAFLPYIIIYAIAVGLMAISLLFYGKERLNNYLFWLTWIALLIFVGLRDASVGSDTANYLSSFHHPEQGYGEKGDTDPGFLMYLYLTHYLLFDNGTLFLLLTALVGLGGIGYVTRRNSAMPVYVGRRLVPDDRLLLPRPTEGRIETVGTQGKWRRDYP